MDSRCHPTVVQLQRFLAVAEDLHFTRAANRLNISQPMLSAQIRELEEVIGTQLFHRTSRKVELTEAGAVLREQAKSLLIGLQDAVAATREVGSGRNAPIRIGYTDEFSRQILPELVRILKVEDETVGIELVMGAVPQLTSDIADGSIDLGLLCPLPSHFEGAWRVQRFPDAEMVVGLRVGHPLANEASVSIEQLEDESFVASNFHNAGSERLADRLFAERSLTRRIAQRAADPHLMTNLAAAGVGILFGTEADFAPYPTLAAIPLDPPVRLTRGAVSRSSNHGRLLEKAHRLLSLAV